MVVVHFKKWPDKYDAQKNIQDKDIQPPNTKCEHWRYDLEIDDKVRYKPRKGWVTATILENNSAKVVKLGWNKYETQKVERRSKKLKKYVPKNTESDSKNNSINPNWRQELDVGSIIDCRDDQGDWCAAVVMEMLSGTVKVHYKCWPHKYDENLDINDQRITAPNRKIQHWRYDLQINDLVDVKIICKWVVRQVCAINKATTVGVLWNGRQYDVPRKSNELKQNANSYNPNAGNSGGGGGGGIGGFFGNLFGGGGKKIFRINQNTFFNAWIDVLNEVHVENTRVIRPNSVHQFMQKEDPTSVISPLYCIYLYLSDVML